MTQTVTYDPDGDNVDLLDRIRLGSEAGFVERAEHGDPGVSRVTIDDPAGELALYGWKTITVDEDEADVTRLHTGLLQGREQYRGESLVTGSSRRIDADIVDLNQLLQMVLITGSDGKRPAEGADTRLAWFLASDYTAGITDQGHVNVPHHQLDAVDYRNRYGLDVLTDIALPIDWNFWVNEDPDSGLPELFLMNPQSGDYTTTVRISNDADDIDSDPEGGSGVTKTYAGTPARLQRDPKDVYSTVAVAYARGSVYETNAATATAFAPRGVVAPNADAKTSTEAHKIAKKLLKSASYETDRIPVAVDVALEDAGSVRAGHLMSAKFTHLDGYKAYAPMTTFGSFRVVSRGVGQTERTTNRVTLDLILAPITIATCGTDDVNESDGTVTAQHVVEEGSITWALATISGWFGGPVDRPISDNVPNSPSAANDGDDSTYSGADAIMCRGDGVVATYWDTDLGDVFSVCKMDGTLATGSNSWVSKQPYSILYSTDGLTWTTADVSWSYYTASLPHRWIATFPDEIEAQYWRIRYAQHSVPGPFGLWVYDANGTRVYSWRIFGGV